MRIYLVSNEPIIRKILTQFLSNLKHEVVSIKSTFELLDKLEAETQPIDLIIGDFNMPEEKTISLIHKIHKQYPDIPIIITVTDGPLFSAREAISYGIRAYLRKPIYLSELELVLEQLFKSRTN